MAWRTAYAAPALGTTDGLGASNYNYVVRIPAAQIVDTDAVMRLALRGPAFGQSRVQSMWVGHAASSGDSYDFDGGQVRVTFGGLHSVTLGNVSATTDGVAFQIVPGKDLIVAYELIAGDSYQSSSAAANHSQHWKSGSGDAGTTNKIGYATGAGRTAIVESISVTDSAVPPPPPPPPPPPVGGTLLSGSAAVAAGQVHSAGGDIPGTAGQCLHFMLLNQSGSGRQCFLHQIMITPTMDTVATLRSGYVAMASGLPKCNLMFGAGGSIFDLTYGFSPTILGEIHSIFRLRAGEPTHITAPFPLVGFNAGIGVMLALHTPGAGAVCNFEWQQI